MAGAPIIYLTNATLTLKPVASGTALPFQGEVSAAAIVPTAGDEQAVVTLDYIRHARYGPDTYALALTVQQSWIAGSLCEFLWTNRATLVTFSLALSNAAISPTNPAMTGNAMCRAAQFGGEADTWISGEVEMPIDGAPVKVSSLAELDAELSRLAELAQVIDLRARAYAVPELPAEPA